jgi:hypothetical protein
MEFTKSPYYLAARVLNPEARTSFLRNQQGNLTLEGKQQLYIVRKLWERFLREAPPPDPKPSYDAQRGRDDIPEEELSEFEKAHRDMLREAIEADKVDEFEAYICEKAILLPRSRTKAIDWWCLPAQRIRFPQLSRLAIEVLSIPGMSDKPERVFSGARRRVPWDRTKTSVNILEAVECSKDWMAEEILSIPL